MHAKQVFYQLGYNLAHNLQLLNVVWAPPEPSSSNESLYSYTTIGNL